MRVKLSWNGVDVLNAAMLPIHAPEAASENTARNDATGVMPSGFTPPPEQKTPSELES
jgi:hypothetical protein